MSSISIIVLVSILIRIGDTRSIRPYKETDPNHLKVSGIVLKGALVDEYSQQVLIIKIKSPSDVIKDVISRLDQRAMGSNLANSLLRTLGSIELHYQEQFTSTLSLYQELIATPYPISEEEGNGKILDLTSLRRIKRNPLRIIMAFLRMIRPVARTAGKLTKYGKFMKTMKYAGYAATAGVFTYELADIFGAIPDVKYEELTRQLSELHALRTDDLIIMRNITLMSISANENIQDLTKEINSVLVESNDKFEIMIRTSQVFGSYINQLSSGLALLMQGKLPSTLIPLEKQRIWLEAKLPSPLLSDIGSITPHLKIQLKAVDEENGQLVLTVEVPKTGARFQILNYLKWEPKIIINETCYTSPRNDLYLAYPPSSSDEIRQPLLIDPSSCLTEGYILCESDSILEQIAGLGQNRICTKSVRMNSRSKREMDDLFLEAREPTYDISKIVLNSFKTVDAVSENRKKLEELTELLEQRIKESKIISEQSREKLKDAEKEHHVLKMLVIFSIPVCFLCLVSILSLIWKLNKKRLEKLEKRRIKLLNSLK